MAYSPVGRIEAASPLDLIVSARKPLHGFKPALRAALRKLCANMLRHESARRGRPPWKVLKCINRTPATAGCRNGSIAIAVHYGQIMGQLVQANSIPFVIGGFSDITPEGERVLSMDLLNRGVGPAKQRSLRVKVDDRYVTSVDQLLAA